MTFVVFPCAVFAKSFKASGDALKTVHGMPAARKHLLDGADSRTPSKEQGRLEGRAKSRRFDEYLRGSLPWGIVLVTRLHLYFQSEKVPHVRGFAFVINKEHGRGGFLADGTTAGCESQMAGA